MSARGPPGLTAAALDPFPNSESGRIKMSYIGIARPVLSHPALTYLRLADLICQRLAELNADCAPVAWLSRTLGVSAAELRATLDYALHLGICEEPTGPVLYCLPRGPIAAGFRPVHRDGRMSLRLPGRGLRPALLIRGCRVGPAPEHERGMTLGAGELAYTVCRLTLLAGRWLPGGPDPTRRLFELVAEGWRHASGTRHLGGLGIHRASFDQPIAVRPVTNRLELVTNRRKGGHELVNVYPIPARGVAR